VAPSVESAQDGSYKMTRPLYIYVRTDSLKLPHVQAFTTYYLDVVNDLIGDIGYIAQPEEDLEKAKAALQDAIGA
jgi:phosphate transport system substrate-binding protein